MGRESLNDSDDENGPILYLDFETGMLQKSPTSCWQTQQAATVGATRTSRKTLSSTDEPLLFLGAGWVKLASCQLVEMSVFGLLYSMKTNPANLET